jgi:hypothetical protein
VDLGGFMGKLSLIHCARLDGNSLQGVNLWDGWRAEMEILGQGAGTLCAKCCKLLQAVRLSTSPKCVDLRLNGHGILCVPDFLDSDGKQFTRRGESGGLIA